MRDRNFSMYLVGAAVLILIIVTFFMDSGSFLPASAILKNDQKSDASGSFEDLIKEYESTGQIPQANSQSLNNLPSGVNISSLKSSENSNSSVSVFKFVEGEKFVIALEAALPDPVQGEAYFAWLVPDKESQSYYLLGKLSKKEDKFFLSSSPNIEVATYKWLIISQDAVENNQPEKIVLQGTI